MRYKQFGDLNLSALGMGTMRLPLMGDRKTIDKEVARLMIAYAIEHGVNYFDTALPYHNGLSEVVIGELLAEYPRDKWYLATKFPGHQHSATFDPAATFERQLNKCGVDYFDFYLYHNICENCLDDYLNPRWGILDYFVEQRKLGRIRHLGFSSHATPQTLEAILDGPYGKVIEFCQIQLNYLDWTLQDAQEKFRILNERHIPIWVMEPVRGGKLARLTDDEEKRLKAVRPDESIASWAFRWLQGMEGITMILSGMSDMAQMQDNIRTFDNYGPLSEEERTILEDIVANMHKTIPCTACRYCCDGCPQELDIPMLIATYNDLSLEFTHTPMMRLESLPKDKLPSACLGCGACARICPQGIAIPEVLADLDKLFHRFPKWADICKERNKITGQ